jgi:hypothetical protein
MYSMKRLFALLLLSLPQKVNAQDSARVVGNAVQVLPLGMQISLPAAWLGVKADPPSGMCDDQPSGAVSDRLLTRREQFVVLPAPSTEWKKEYAAVVDSVMPFPRLVAHLGGDPWLGFCGAMHLRIYIGDASLKLNDARMAVAKRVADRYFRSTVATTETTPAGWERRRISWNAYYYDYGGDATIEFFTRREANRTVVLVFMLHGHIASQQRQRDAIVQSWRRSVSRQ